MKLILPASAGRLVHLAEDEQVVKKSSIGGRPLIEGRKEKLLAVRASYEWRRLQGDTHIKSRDHVAKTWGDFEKRDPGTMVAMLKEANDIAPFMIYQQIDGHLWCVMAPSHPTLDWPYGGGWTWGEGDTTVNAYARAGELLHHHAIRECKEIATRNGPNSGRGMWLSSPGLAAPVNEERAAKYRFLYHNL